MVYKRMAETHLKKTVVVKIGSSLLTGARGVLSRDMLDAHCTAVASLRKVGHTVLIVSSGAIAAGFSELGFVERPKSVQHKQAAAAVGQSILMHAYRESFLASDITVAQVLLSRKDFAIRESYNNALNTLSFLMERGVVPVINENDTVATREITFGDNDVLSALVGTLVHADMVIILTDIDGLYTGNPRTDATAARIDRVQTITPEIFSLADAHGSSVGTGGMLAKIKAAEVALSLGSRLYVGSGINQPEDHLLRVLEGKGTGTYFGAEPTPMQRKKQWIAYHSEVCGRVMIDQGAEYALISQGTSLLPVGVIAVSGSFRVDDVIEVLNHEGILLGKGVARLTIDEVRQVLGCASPRVRELLGRDKVEVIHRDNFVRMQVSEGESREH